MNKLLTNKYALGAITVLLVLAAIWGYGHYQYSQGVVDTETAARLAAFDQYQGDVERMASASWGLQNIITELQYAKPKVITKYKRVAVQAPLPDTCRIDADRLRGIQSAVSAATAAR